MCVIYNINLNKEGIAHVDIIVVIVVVNVENVELNIGDNNLIFVIFFIDEVVVLYIGFNV